MKKGNGIKARALSILLFSAYSAPVLSFDNTNILVEEAVNHIYQQRYKKAHQTLKEAYEKSPRHPGVHFNLGRLFELTGNFDEALKEYRLAATLDTSMVAARRGIARCGVELKRRKVQQAKVPNITIEKQTAPIVKSQPARQTQTQRPVIVTQNLTREPAPPTIQLPEVPRLPQMNNSDDSRLPPLPTKIAQQVSQKSSAENKAEKLINEGKTDQAIAELNRILQQNGDSANAHFLMGKALSLTSDLFGSIKHLEEAIRVDEKTFDAYFLLGRNYAKVNLLEDAIKNYQIYYGVKPQASVALEIARIYENMGRLDLAKSYYSKANTMNPGNANLQSRLSQTTGNLANDLYLRGNHAYTVGLHKEAINLFQQALNTKGLQETYKRDAIRKIEVARFKTNQLIEQQRPAKEGFQTSRKIYGSVNLRYSQLADINFKTRFTGPITVEWTGHISRIISRHGRDFLLMIKELSRDELDEMRRDRNDYRLNKHFNNQPVFLVAAPKGQLPKFAKEGKVITFTGTTDWRFYSVINDMGQSINLPSFDYVSGFPESN
jgi:tetratricopeptide (TPR) repeat protein